MPGVASLSRNRSVPGTRRVVPAVLSDAERTDALAAGHDILRRATVAEGFRDAYRTGTATAPQTRRVLGRLAADAREAAQDRTQPLVEGSISRAAWYKRLRSDLVPRYYAGAAAALGRDTLDGAALADTRRRIAQQLGYLRRMQGDLALGVTPLNGRAVQRAGLYGGAVWTLGQEVARTEDIRQGYDEERAVLGTSRNCDTCLDRNAQGWQPVGMLSPLGDSPCGSNCRCYWERRKSRGKDVASSSAILKGAGPFSGQGGLAGELTFDRSPGAADGRRYSVVLVDVRKVDASLAEDRNFYVGPGGTGAGIAGRYQEAERFLRKAKEEGIQVHMPRLALPDARPGEVSIGDGRHRWAVLRDSGATAVPVVVARGEARQVAERFGYRPRPEAVRAPAFSPLAAPRKTTSTVSPPVSVPAAAVPLPARTGVPAAPVLPGQPIAERLAADTESARTVERIAAVGARADEASRQLAASRAAADRIARETDDLVRQTGGAIPVAERQRLSAAYRAARDEATTHEATIRDALAAQRQEVHALLAADRPQRWTYLGAGIDHEVIGPKVKEAEGFLAPILARRIDDNPAVVYVPLKGKNARAFFDDKTRQVRVGIVDEVKVLIHERGHHLEEIFPEVGKAAREFLAHRVGNEPATRLNTVEKGYSADEVGRKDRFDAHFPGVLSYYVGKSYQKATEITSMGLQAFYEDPVGFARNDPEYAQFIVGVLRGTI